MAYYYSNGGKTKIDREWIIGGVFLFLPVLRIPGALILARKLRKTLNINGGLGLLVTIAAIMFATGGLYEVLAKSFIPLLVLTLLAIVAGGLVYVGKNREDRCRDYQAFFVGMDSVKIPDMARIMGRSERTILRDLKYMRKKNMLPEGAYIDFSRNLLVLTQKGRPVEKAEKQEAPKPDTNIYERVLRQIRALNDEIQDEVVSRKIDHIERTTAGIFEYVRQKPEALPTIQTFMEYYLPTTLKLLSEYAHLERQIDVGENIINSKRRIEDIMDKVVFGFNSQLDKLYKSNAVDITNDVKVLEKMMRMDGLGK